MLILENLKGMGGLGIRNVAMFNRAMLYKYAWRCDKQKQDLLSRLYSAKYGILLLQAGGKGVSKPHWSWGFKGMCRVATEFHKETRMKLGTSRDINTTGDKWVNNSEVSFKANTSVQTRCSKILNTYIPETRREDEQRWSFTKSGNYSVKSGYGFLVMGSDDHRRYQDDKEGMSKLSVADTGKAKDAARASGKKKGTTLSQLKKRAVPAGSETPSTFKKPKPLPRRLVKKDESKVAEGGCPDDEEMGVDKPSLVVDLVSKSRSGGHPDELEDPLSGIPADVRSQIPAEVARRARSSGAKDKGKDAAAAEDENVPATPHYSSKDRVAICRKVFKAVPAEYVASLPGRKTDAQFGAIQATLLDLFCRMEFCKSWKTRTAEELKAQVAESTHHGDYAFKSIEEVRLQMQTTIDLQAKEVAALRSDKAELLKKILAQDKDMVAMVEEAKTAAAEIRALQDQLREYPQVKEAAEEAEHLRGELETARSQVRTLRERLLESYDQGEQATKDAVKHAWESHMSEYDLGWFQRRMEHSAAVLAAERLGQPPPEFVSSDDEDDAAAP
ncbi:uncharacterized protein [Spinacia oleracea]|uniref:Uncharacterized protein n=2 Tax=Spinacia oleracea TaxID=3562 RepID=A0ABM3RGQ1_SPIOL|nr:uncharacterized protein LOC130469473 [Spinacia oleracea]